MKVGHIPLQLRTSEISPAPDNQKLYRPVTPDDEATIELAESIKKRGVLEPIVISEDGYIISGHRRHCAARLAGLSEIPCRRLPGVRRGNGNNGSPEFLALLREHNRQRVKTRDELLREAVVSVDPEQAHKALSEYRTSASKFKAKPIELREVASRKMISQAKADFLEAIRDVINNLEEFWPVTLRQIHYGLLNNPPLRHASKPDSRYQNDLRSYKDLCDLATRMRHEGYIDYEVIDDPTRPVTTWNVHRDLSSYYEQQIQAILNGYWRDLLQSQPNHVELIVEKNTLNQVVRPIAGRFCLPFTSGRGQCSTAPLHGVAKNITFGRSHAARPQSRSRACGCRRKFIAT